MQTFEEIISKIDRFIYYLNQLQVRIEDPEVSKEEKIRSLQLLNNVIKKHLEELSYLGYKKKETLLDHEKSIYEEQKKSFDTIFQQLASFSNVLSNKKNNPEQINEHITQLTIQLQSYLVMLRDTIHEDYISVLKGSTATNIALEILLDSKFDTKKEPKLTRIFVENLALQITQQINLSRYRKKLFFKIRVSQEMIQEIKEELLSKYSGLYYLWYRQPNWFKTEGIFELYKLNIITIQNFPTVIEPESFACCNKTRFLSQNEIENLRKLVNIYSSAYIAQHYIFFVSVAFYSEFNRFFAIIERYQTRNFYKKILYFLEKKEPIANCESLKSIEKLERAPHKLREFYLTLLQEKKDNFNNFHFATFIDWISSIDSEIFDSCSNAELERLKARIRKNIWAGNDDKLEINTFVGIANQPLLGFPYAHDRISEKIGDLFKRVCRNINLPHPSLDKAKVIEPFLERNLTRYYRWPFWILVDLLDRLSKLSEIIDFFDLERIDKYIFNNDHPLFNNDHPFETTYLFPIILFTLSKNITGVQKAWMESHFIETEKFTKVDAQFFTHLIYRIIKDEHLVSICMPFILSNPKLFDNVYLYRTSFRDILPENADKTYVENLADQINIPKFFEIHSKSTIQYSTDIHFKESLIILSCLNNTSTLKKQLYEIWSLDTFDFSYQDFIKYSDIAEFIIKRSSSPLGFYDKHILLLENLHILERYGINISSIHNELSIENLYIILSQGNETIMAAQYLILTPSVDKAWYRFLQSQDLDSLLVMFSSLLILSELIDESNVSNSIPKIIKTKFTWLSENQKSNFKQKLSDYIYDEYVKRFGSKFSKRDFLTYLEKGPLFNKNNLLEILAMARIRFGTNDSIERTETERFDFSRILSKYSSDSDLLYIVKQILSQFHFAEQDGLTFKIRQDAIDIQSFNSENLEKFRSIIHNSSQKSNIELSELFLKFLENPTEDQFQEFKRVCFLNDISIVADYVQQNREFLLQKKKFSSESRTDYKYPDSDYLSCDEILRERLIPHLQSLFGEDIKKISYSYTAEIDSLIAILDKEIQRSPSKPNKTRIGDLCTKLLLLIPSSTTKELYELEKYLLNVQTLYLSDTSAPNASVENFEENLVILQTLLNSVIQLELPEENEFISSAHFIKARYLLQKYKYFVNKGIDNYSIILNACAEINTGVNQWHHAFLQPLRECLRNYDRDLIRLEQRLSIFYKDGPLYKLSELCAKIQIYLTNGKGIIVVEGECFGKVRIITRENQKFEPGNILVASNPTPDITHLLIRAGAIITQEGGSSSHVCQIAREFKIPCIVGLPKALNFFTENDYWYVNTQTQEFKRIDEKDKEHYLKYQRIVQESQKKNIPLIDNLNFERLQEFVKLPHIVPISRANSQIPASERDTLLCGGKGANLGILEKLSQNQTLFKTARGVVLTSGFFAQIMLDNWNSLNFDIARITDEKLYTYFKQHISFSSLLIDELEKDVLPLGWVSVRSSAVDEDGDNSTFAGIHESYLWKRRLEPIKTAIASCYASMFIQRAILHRKRIGADIRNSAMAVVIQKMIDANFAGVAYTILSEPMAFKDKIWTVSNDTMKIEFVIGAGEGIVSGEKTPVMVLVNKKTKAYDIVSFENETILQKMVRLHPRWRTMMHDAIEVLPKLIDALLFIEQSLNKPQDVEFIVKDKQLYILQTRAYVLN